MTIQGRDLRSALSGDGRDWLLQGLYDFHFGSAFSDRKYALYPLELDDQDYAADQIVRKIRDADPALIPALLRANDQALATWTAEHEIEIQSSLLGIASKIGSRQLRGVMRYLMAPEVQRALPELKKPQLFSALSEALIGNSDFSVGTSLFDEFIHSGATQRAFSNEDLAAILTRLIVTAPYEWRRVLLPFADKLVDGPKVGSPFSKIFFAWVDAIPIKVIKDLLDQGGEDEFHPSTEGFMVEWLFVSTDPASLDVPPLKVIRSTGNRYTVWPGRSSEVDQILLSNPTHRTALVFERIIGKPASGASETSVRPGLASNENIRPGSTNNEQVSIPYLIDSKLAGGSD